MQRALRQLGARVTSPPQSGKLWLTAASPIHFSNSQFSRSRAPSPVFFARRCLVIAAQAAHRQRADAIAAHVAEVHHGSGNSGCLWFVAPLRMPRRRRLFYREQAMTDLRPMTGPLKLAVFVALCAIMFVIVIATEGNPLVVIAVVLSAIFLAGRLASSR